MKKNRKVLLCAALAAAVLISGCSESKVVENGGADTGVKVSDTTPSSSDTTAVDSEEETTTTTTTSAATSASDASDTENNGEADEGSEDRDDASETKADAAPAQTTAAPAQTTAAPAQNTTAATAAQNNSGGGQAPAQTTKQTASTTAAPQTPTQTYAETKAHVSGYRYGNVKYELKHDIEYMKNLSSDFVGWLTVEETPIDLPVVQGTDNKFYLEHNFYGEYDYTKVGATFADCHVPITETSRPDNIVIYGHNIRTGVGLAKVTNYYPARYGSLSFYRNHPIVHFDSITGDQSQYVVFAGMFVNTQTKHGDVFNYHRFRNFDNEDIFYQYFEAVFDRSVFYNPDLDIKYGDKFLTLSTCYYPWGEGVDTRFVAFARQLRPGERVVTTKNAFVNPSPLYFDYYYRMVGGSWAGRKWDEALITGYSEWKKNR